jgi:small multidrug resistance family-3 protein
VAGVYIVASLLWLWIVERKAPSWSDIAGSAVCLIGAGIILFAPRGAGA